jgi:lipoyl(octanoyl) transferase
MQSRLHEQRAAGEVIDTLLLLEHPHVFTIGRRGTRADVLWDLAALHERGVEVVETDRGGMVTYHGPGQLVGYPIVDLGPQGDLVGYLRRLEDVLIAALADHGIEAGRLTGATGVWVGFDKVGAIGVRVTRGVTKHGFALNVSPDLSYFGGIVPCGILDKGVTSMQRLLGDAPSVEALARTVTERFGEVFGYGARP